MCMYPHVSLFLHSPASGALTFPFSLQCFKFRVTLQLLQYGYTVDEFVCVCMFVCVLMVELIIYWHPFGSIWLKNLLVFALFFCYNISTIRYSHIYLYLQLKIRCQGIFCVFCLISYQSTSSGKDVKLHKALTCRSLSFYTEKWAGTYSKSFTLLGWLERVGSGRAGTFTSDGNASTDIRCFCLTSRQSGGRSLTVKLRECNESKLFQISQY